MKNKKLLMKILVDIGMMLCLLFLMPYSLLGETAHEWIGMAMLVLFIAHHLLNRKWLMAIAKGKYSLFRTIQTMLVILMLFLMFGSMISGILLSNHIFRMIRVEGTAMMARQIHMFCAYWGLVVMSLHLGMHCGMLITMTKRLWKKPSALRSLMARVAALAVAAYGIYAFAKRQIGEYLLMKMHFAFYDFDEGVFPFLFDYLVIMLLLAIAGYYVGMLLKKKQRS